MTDYLKLAQETAPPPEDEANNPYLALAQEDQAQQQVRARSVLELALKDKPDVAAERQRLAQTSGLPLRVVERNLDEIRVKEQARAIDLVRMMQDSPVLARQLTDPAFATTAVDDLDTLTKIERAVGHAVRYMMGADGKGGLQADLPGFATDLALGGTAGVGKALFDITGVVYDALGADNWAAEMRGRAKRAQESMDFYGSQNDSSTGKAVKSGLQSAGTNLAAMPLGLERGLFASAEAAATAVTAWMGAGVGSGAYNQARDEGKGKVGAAVFGIPQGVFEYVFEKIPASKLFGDIAANTGLLKTLRTQALSEGWTEQVTTLAQDFNEWMNLNPEKTLGDFIAERPEAAYQTFIATLVGVGVQTTTIHAINKIVEKASDQRLQFQQDAFSELMKLAGGSALRERSPEQFRQHMEVVVGQTDGASKSIFVDGQVLDQLPEEVLAQLPESVRAQIPDAALGNGTVEIPIADVLTIAPGTPLEQVLNDNARMTPDAMSRADAVAAGDKAEVLKQEAQRVIQQAQDQQAAQAEYDAVHAMYRDQLTATGRVRPAVADMQAHWIASFYTAYGSRTGMSASEFQQRYPLRVMGAPSAPGQVMDQGKVGEITVEGYHFSKEDRTVISTGAFGTGLQGSSKDEYLNAADRRLAKRSYFYADKGTGIRPESGVGGRAHRVNLANVYDSNLDPQGLKKGPGGKLGFESRVLDAGFGGYLDRLEGTQPGQVVMLGDQTFQPELLGAQSRIETGKRLPAMARVEPTWQTQASGDPAALQAKLEKMQANPAWGGYDLRVEGDELQSMKKQVLEQGARVEPAGETDLDRSSSLDGVRISPRNPTGASVSGSGMGENRLQPTIAAMPEGMVEKTAAEFLKYPNFAGLTGTPREILEQAKQHMKDNLRALMNAFPDDLYARARMWYVGGNRIARALSAEYGVPVENVALAMAALSPQKNWFENVSSGERVIDIVVMHSQEPWSPEMTAVANARGWFEDPKISQFVGGAEGKTLRDMYDAADPDAFTRMAWWVRAYDEAHNPRTLSVITPEGTFIDKLFSARTDGQPTPLRWGSAGEIGKAIAALVARTPESRSTLAGGAHKVRSFFNNIAAPYSPGGDVTVDTHAVAAALLRPLGGTTHEVQNVLSGGVSKDDALLGFAGIGKSIITGSTGAYGVYADAYRELAAEFEMLPREIQSITWEAVRLLFDAKGATLKVAASETWARFSRGDITHDQAVATLFGLAGGIGRPDWAAEQPTPQPAGSSYRRLPAATGPTVLEQSAAAGRAILNVGLSTEEVAGGGQIDEGAVRQRLADMGVDVEAVDLYQSDSELTAVVQIGRPLTPAEADALSAALQQEAIAQVVDGQGTMFGPKAEEWGPYNPDYFVMPDGRRASAGAAATGRATLADFSISLDWGGEPEVKVPQTETTEFKVWSGGNPLVLAADAGKYRFQTGEPVTVEGFHGTRRDFERHDPALASDGYFLSSKPVVADEYAGVLAGRDNQINAGGNIQRQFVRMDNPLFINARGASFNRVDTRAVPGFDGGALSNTDAINRWAKAQGYDGVIYKDLRDSLAAPDGRNATPSNVYAVFEPTRIKSAIGNDGSFDRNDPSFLSQKAQTPRGTFNPRSLELVLNPNANLSTWFHETGHFFLEVMADIASQPNAPAQIVEDMGTFLKWAGVADLATWNALDLDGKRQYHERWAESIEQYVMEGKAPSVELQPLMRRFATWLKSVYGSIQKFLAARGQATSGPVLGQSAQPDLFPGEFATKRTTVVTSQVIDSKGTRAKGSNTNSKGQQVTATKQGLQRFWDWFAGSEATDDKGRPLVLYHSTNSDIAQFETNRETTNSYGILGEMTVRRAGIFLTPDLKFSQEYLRDGAGQNVMRVYAALKNPLDLRRGISERVEAELEAAGVNVRYVNNVQNVWELFDSADDGTNEFVDGLKAAGYDGAIFREDSPGGESEGGTTYVAFESSQVKSAIGNDGTFDANDPSILSQDPNAQPGPPMALNDDIRRVMDRMLATDEQIAQANEVAGLVPDENADALAAERLNKRSMADLKWAVRAFDQVIAKLQKQAKAIEKEVRAVITTEVDATPEMRAKRALDALAVTPEYAGLLAEHKAARKAAEATAREEVKAALLGENPDAKGLAKGQLLMKNKRDIDNKVDAAMIKWDQANPTPKRSVNATDADVATIADSFEFESVDAMMQAIDAFGSRKDAIDGLTDRRMLEEHGDLIDDAAIRQAANEAVHNEARARSLATELRTQGETLNARADTGRVNAKGSKITVNALMAAAKQFGANVVARTPLRDLKAKAWQHTAAERRAGKRWQEATAAGKTQEAVQAKQDQMLQHAAATAALDAQAEAKKIVDFFRRVLKGNDETVVEKGRDPDIVNAARSVLAAYGLQSPASKGAQSYLDALQRHDEDTWTAVAPMVAAATQNAQPLDALTFEELQGLHESIQAMWHLAKESRTMEVNGDKLDLDDVQDELYDRLEEIGIPDVVPGELEARTAKDDRSLLLKQAGALLRRVEQWAEGIDGKHGGPFLKYTFQVVKKAADKYRTERTIYRKKFMALVDNIVPTLTGASINAPELGYNFKTGADGIGMGQVLHAILHTGNESNKRKLLLGRGWATENPDGTLNTGALPDGRAGWDAFIARLVNEGTLKPEHFAFAQGVWDLLEETKPGAQKTHRDVFGRFFAEVTADAFVDPFGVQRRGGYVPAQTDPRLVKDRQLAEKENAGMAYAFPAPGKGFTMARVEYNKPLMLDLRTLPQHIDKVLLFTHMTPATRGVKRLLSRPKVNQPLNRIDPAAIDTMLDPWLARSAQQIVETPVVGAGKWARIPSIVRARAGMGLMFANVSNTLQQITGFSTALVKVRPGPMTRALAQYVAHPVQTGEAVRGSSKFMAQRASNEIAVLSDTMEKILLKPSVYERAEMWTREHAYFMQSAFDNVMGPIIWTGAFNQGVADGMTDDQAADFADGVIRTTQGSTLPEDVSRFETGPAYARVFTQFIGYFNMLANTNATAIKQIAGEVGLKKGAGRALGVVFVGMLMPIWVAEAIAVAFKGGPDDEDKDGYLDDWLAAVFGFGTVKGMFAQVPIVGMLGQRVVNSFNDNPADDKFSLSPAVSILESAGGSPTSVYKAIVDDGNAQKAVRDVAALVSIATGAPALAIARPVGYAAGVAQGRIQPTSAADAVRGLVTGTASPESKVK